LKKIKMTDVGITSIAYQPIIVPEGILISASTSYEVQPSRHSFIYGASECDKEIAVRVESFAVGNYEAK
jgi:hypothetical protein